MALSTLEINTIDKGMLIAKQLVEDIKPIVDELNIIYDSIGGVKSTVTQQNLDTVQSYSGITKQQLDDGFFAITSTLKGVLDNAYSQLATIAARK